MRIKEIPLATNEQILRHILDAVKSVRNGHFTAHMIDSFPGLASEIGKEMNALIDMLQNFRAEHHRIMEEVGVTGRLGGQAEVPQARGAWAEMITETSRMSGHITGQCRDQGNVVRDLLQGDLSARVTCQCIQGEFTEFREELNELAERFARGAEVETPV